MTKSDMVEVSKADYEELVSDKEFLSCLMAVGVDSWEGYEEAQEMFEENE